MKKRKGKIVAYNMRSFAVLYFRDGHRISTTFEKIDEYLKSIGYQSGFEAYIYHFSGCEVCEMLTEFYRKAF